MISAILLVLAAAAPSHPLARARMARAQQLEQDALRNDPVLMRDAAVARERHMEPFTLQACVIDNEVTKLDRAGNPAIVRCPRDEWDSIVKEARRERTAFVLAHLADEGYGRARWGMTRAQVRHLYPQAISKDRALEFFDRIERFRVAVAFRFTNGYLTAALVAILHHQHVQMTEDEIHDTFQALLARKYGPPKQIENEDVLWSTKETAIDLRRTGLDLDASSVIIYSSTDLAEMAEKIDTKAAESKL